MARGRRVDTARGYEMNEMAEAVRRSCVEAALRAYEDAGLRGLCAEGRWEAAVAAMRSLELEPVVRNARSG